MTTPIKGTVCNSNAKHMANHRKKNWISSFSRSGDIVGVG